MKQSRKRKYKDDNDDDDDSEENEKKKPNLDRLQRLLQLPAPSVLSSFTEPINDSILCGVRQCFTLVTQQTMHTLRLCNSIDAGKSSAQIVQMFNAQGAVHPNWKYKMPLMRGETTLLGSLAARPVICTPDVLKCVFNPTYGVQTVSDALDLEFSDASNNRGTALMFATIFNNVTLTKALLEHGADPNRRCWDAINNREGSSTLILACLSGHHAIVTLLLERRVQLKIDINQRNSFQWTPLHAAVMAKRPEIVSELFLQALSDLDPWIQDVNGKMAMDYTTPECPRTKAALHAGLQHANVHKQLWTYAMNRELEPLLSSIDLCIVLVHQYVWSSSSHLV